MQQQLCLSIVAPLLEESALINFKMNKMKNRFEKDVEIRNEKKKFIMMSTEDLIRESVGEMPAWKENFICQVLFRRIPDHRKFSDLVNRVLGIESSNVF